MKATDYWQIFLETGAPEAYVMYAQALKAEAGYVSDNTGFGASGNGLQ